MFHKFNRALSWTLGERSGSDICQKKRKKRGMVGGGSSGFSTVCKQEDRDNSTEQGQGHYMKESTGRIDQPPVTLCPSGKWIGERIKLYSFFIYGLHMNLQHWWQLMDSSIR